MKNADSVWACWSCQRLIIEGFFKFCISLIYTHVHSHLSHTNKHKHTPTGGDMCVLPLSKGLALSVRYFHRSCPWAAGLFNALLEGHKIPDIMETYQKIRSAHYPAALHRSAELEKVFKGRHTNTHTNTTSSQLQLTIRPEIWKDLHCDFLPSLFL